MQNLAGQLRDLQGETEAPRPKSYPLPPDISACYDIVVKIEDQLKLLADQIQQFPTIYAVFLAAPQPAEQHQLTQQLADLTRTIDQETRSVGAWLTQLDQSGRLLGDGYNIIMETQHQHLLGRMKELARQFQLSRTECQLKYRDQIKYQYRIALDQDPTEEQVDLAVEQPGIFRQKILADKRHADAANAYLFVQERYDDIQLLGQKLEQVHQMMIDLAFLVEAQGDTLDIIENNVHRVERQQSSILSDIEKGADLARQGRKKMCIILSLIACIVGVILLVLAVIVLVTVCGAGYCKKKK